MELIFLKSELALLDTKHAIKGFTGSEQSIKFRIKCYTIVSLFRSIGYILKKVDSKKYPDLSPYINQQFEEDKIRPEYIEFDKFRNKILKEYEFDFESKFSFKSAPGVFVSIDVVNATVEFELENEKIELNPSVKSGMYEGKTIKDFFIEAYDFWFNHIENIKSKYQSHDPLQKYIFVKGKNSRNKIISLMK